MTASSAIIYGVFAGVVTSMFTYLMGRVVEEIILPWYRDFVYRGIRIDGEWEAFTTDTPQKASLQLTQRADRLQGTCTFVLLDQLEKQDGFEPIRTCNLTGRITDRFVELSFRHVDRSRLGAGVFLLEVVGDGRRMKGHQTFYSVASERILSSVVSVLRPDSTGAQISSQRQLRLEPGSPRSKRRRAKTGATEQGPDKKQPTSAEDSDQNHIAPSQRKSRI